jgi:hypothetical protein
MAHGSAPTQRLRGNEWKAVATLLPYLWEYKWRVVIALIFLITAKLANVGVPLIMKQVVDNLDPSVQVVAVPFALLAIYGLLRFSTTHWNQGAGPLQVRGGSETGPCPPEETEGDLCTFAKQEILDASGAVVAFHDAGVSLCAVQMDV